MLRKSPAPCLRPGYPDPSTPASAVLEQILMNARKTVMRGIDLGRGLVKRLARQRRFEPPLS